MLSFVSDIVLITNELNNVALNKLAFMNLVASALYRPSQKKHQ